MRNCFTGKSTSETFSTSGAPTLRMSSMKYLTAPLMRVWMHHHLMNEVLQALMKMRSGKAGGKNGILPEMLL